MRWCVLGELITPICCLCLLSCVVIWCWCVICAFSVGSATVTAPARCLSVRASTVCALSSSWRIHPTLTKMTTSNRGPELQTMCIYNMCSNVTSRYVYEELNIVLCGVILKTVWINIANITGSRITDHKCSFKTLPPVMPLCSVQSYL